MPKMFEVTNCRLCGKPMQLVPLVGWAHVNVLDNVVCEGEA